MPAALDKVVGFLRAADRRRTAVGVGHRVVHGGPDYQRADGRSRRACSTGSRASCRSLRCISRTTWRRSRRSCERQPQVLQVACFDTAFHRGHPEVADRFAIPESALCRGRSPLRISRPVVRIHCAAAPRRRAGDCRRPRRRRASRQRRIDVRDLVGAKRRKHDGLHRARWAADGHAARSARRRRRALPDEREGDERRRRSSACSTTNAGSRACPASATTCASCSASDDPRAKLALDYFIYRIALFTGMLAAAMGGIDGFVFTAGIGENAPAIREAVARAAGVAWPRASIRRRTRRASSGFRASGRASPATSFRPTRS